MLKPPKNGEKKENHSKNLQNSRKTRKVTELLKNRANLRWNQSQCGINVETVCYFVP